MRFAWLAITLLIVVVTSVVFSSHREVPFSSPEGSHTRIINRVELPLANYAVFLVYQEGLIDVGEYGVYYNQKTAKDLSSSNFELVASIAKAKSEPTIRVSNDCIIVSTGAEAELIRFDTSLYAKIFGGAKNVANGETWNERLDGHNTCFKREVAPGVQEQ